MKILKVVVIFFATSVFLIFSLSCNKSSKIDQTKKFLPNVNSAPVGYNGSQQGSVESEGSPIFSKSNNREESISSTYLMNLWLVFSDSNKNEISRKPLPAKSMAELNSYVRYRLRIWLTPHQPGTDMVKQDMDIMIEAIRVKNQLKNIEIEAPDGRRKISELEAGRLIEFVTVSAFDLSKELSVGI